MLFQIFYAGTAGGVFLTSFMAAKDKGTFVLLVCSVIGVLLGLSCAWAMKKTVEYFGKQLTVYNEKKRQIVTTVMFFGAIAFMIASPFITEYLIGKILTIMLKV